MLFSPVQNGEINNPASDEAKRAVNEALTRKDHLNDSLYFYNPDITNDHLINTRHVVKTVGNHNICKIIDKEPLYDGFQFVCKVLDFRPAY